MSQWPEPGVYHGIDWDTYRALPLPSPSLLKNGLRSMRRLKRAIDGECQPSEKTTAVGNAVHCIIAGEADERIRIMPTFETDAANLTATGKQSTSKSTGYYKEAKAEWETANESKTVLTEVQWMTAKKVVTNIHRSREPDILIQRSTQEVTVIAEIEGVMTKTRIDGMVRDEGKVWDLKTTSDIEPSAFYRKVKQLNYLFQFGWHNVALANAGADGFQIQSYDVIAAEVGDDYDVGLIQILPFDLLDTWGDIVKETIREYALAMSSGVWRGLYPSVGILQVPNWDMAENEIDKVSWGE